MSNPEIHEIRSSHRWQDMLSEEDRRRLGRAYEHLFPDLIEAGYEVIDEVGSMDGELLRKGQFVHDVQSMTANIKIRHLQHLDALNELHEIGQPLRDYKMDFEWRPLAMVPSKYWEHTGTLTINDIKLDRFGITIFAKKVPRGRGSPAIR